MDFIAVREILLKILKEIHTRPVARGIEVLCDLALLKR